MLASSSWLHEPSSSQCEWLIGGSHLLRGRDYVLDDFFAKLWVVLRSLQNRVVFLGEKTLTGDSPHRPRKSIEPLVRNAHSLHVHRRSQPARSGADQQDESNCGLREHGWPLWGRRSHLVGVRLHLGRRNARVNQPDVPLLPPEEVAPEQKPSSNKGLRPMRARVEKCLGPGTDVRFWPRWPRRYREIWQIACPI